jgi:hypothetical protein
MSFPLDLSWPADGCDVVPEGFWLPPTILFPVDLFWPLLGGAVMELLLESLDDGEVWP